MKIFDKRRDYYDNIQGEPTPTWKRDERVYRLGEAPELSRHFNNALIEAYRRLPDPNRRVTRVSHRVHKIVVGFCGKLYPVFWHNTYIGRPQDVISDPTASGFVKKFNKTVEHHTHRIAEEKRQKSYWMGFPFNDKGVEAWESEFGKVPADIFIALKSPVFLIRSHIRAHSEFVVNPLLINFGFQRVIDPYTAYQTIDTYLGNELATAPLDDFQMSDTLKRDSKGMDKWSFRQRGPKKRKA